MQTTNLIRTLRPWSPSVHRKRSVLNSLLAVCAAALISSLAAAASPNDRFGEDYKDFSIEPKSNFAESKGSGLEIVADLGSLRSGDRGIATVTIHNPFEQDIPISSVRASCSCAVSKLLGNKIPAGGSEQLVLALTVPRHRATPDFVGTITLFVDRTASTIPTLREISISIRYDITGMLSFVDRHASFAVLQGEKRTLLIPFTATIPGGAESIAIDATGFLQGSRGSLVQIGDRRFVKIEVSSEDAAPEGVIGQLKLVSSDYNASDTIELVLFVENPIQISPRTIRFRRTEDGLVATAILHFGEPKNNGKALTDDVPAPIFCEVSLSDKKLDVQTQQLSRKVYRVKLALDDSEESLQKLIEKSKDTKEIIWEIVANNERHLSKTVFIITP